jgi:H+/Na+-translocating ferredoxin:NAD+ oxidoreductase subunit C
MRSRQYAGGTEFLWPGRDAREDFAMTTAQQPLPTDALAPSPHVGDPTPLPPPPRVFVPVPSNSNLLTRGTRVARGDALITPAEGCDWIPRSPVDGIVAATRQVDRLGVAPANALEIELEAGGAKTPAAAETPSMKSHDLRSVTDLLRSGNVQADRRTSPDLLAQLHTAQQLKPDTILCNLLDPAGESDLMATVMRTSGDAVLSGLAAIAKACGVGRVWLAADTRVAAAAAPALRKFNLSGASPAIKIIDIPNDYPQADPSLLVYAILKRALRPGRNPAEIGVVLLDAPAAATVGRRVSRNEPLLDVTIEVRESEREACSVRSVPVGTPLRYLLEQLWLKPQRMTLRAGAALRDVRVSPDAIIDGVGELSIEVGPLSPVINPDPCIRCGWCVEACPVRIHPAGILEAAQDSDLRAARWYGMGSCIECGICSYVCPSRLPLLSAIRQMKTENARREIK